MRHIKPQAALVATAHTQIGARPMLAISIGIGFRLSHPAILVHEAGVWEALKVAAPSTPFHEAALPKLRAEWLLAGQSTHQLADGFRARCVDWTASVELDGVRKAVSCQVTRPVLRHSLVADAEVVSLAVDHRHASAGAAQENPAGVKSGAVPLQRVRALGVGAEPLAAMGALGSDWPERRQWMPRRPASPEAMAQDGTHMGWPADVDLRFFQQAAPDQWSRRSAWTCGARFELSGFGPHGGGYAGDLPRLTPVALVTRAGRTGVERLTLEQQSVWFLPDRDIGVIWWNGAVTLDYLLDDSPAMLVAAFKDDAEPVDIDALISFAQLRADLNCTDPTQQADHPLMPSVEKGWTWELILDADDHPRFGPEPRSYAELRARLEGDLHHLIEAQAAQDRLKAFQQSNREVELPAAPRETHEMRENWRQQLRQTQTTTLTSVTIRDADLSSLRFDGWTLDDVRFERCTFDRSEWLNCRFKHVHAADCSFAGMTMRDSTWNGGKIGRCNLERSAWLEVDLERLSVEDCRLDQMKVAGGSWSMLTVQGRGGECGDVRDVSWNAVCWSGVAAPNWSWTRVRADDLAMVECRMTALKISECAMLKPGILSTDLSTSVWQRNVLTFAVLSHDTSIDGARLTDCVFKASSLQNLRADWAHVDHCSFPQLNAQHMQAEHSNWTHAVLDSANLMYACLTGASFERCSLKEAMLYGADLRQTRMRDCNLIQARTAWVHRPDAGAWRANLDAGQLDVPRRRG